MLAFGVALWQLRRTSIAWLAAAGALVALVLSMGSRLWLAGHSVIPLPWRLVAQRPVTRAVTPDRMIVYAWLALAVVVAAWLALPGRFTKWRWALVAVGIFAVLADGSSPLYNGRPDQPALFTTSAYQRVLRRSSEVLALPYGAYGYSMLWQADAHFWFRMPEGYLSSAPPPAFIDSHLAQALMNSPFTPVGPATLHAFIERYRVDTVIVDPLLAGTWPQELDSIGLHGQMIDGALVYQVHGLA